MPLLIVITNGDIDWIAMLPVEAVSAANIVAPTFDRGPDVPPKGSTGLLDDHRLMFTEVTG